MRTLRSRVSDRGPRLSTPIGSPTFGCPTGRRKNLPPSRTSHQAGRSSTVPQGSPLPVSMQRHRTTMPAAAQKSSGRRRKCNRESGRPRVAPCTRDPAPDTDPRLGRDSADNHRFEHQPPRYLSLTPCPAADTACTTRTRIPREPRKRGPIGVLPGATGPPARTRCVSPRSCDRE
jgi:hypothetical protein